MKLLFFAFYVLFTIQTSTALYKDCNCLKDLDFVIENLKNTPSFKSQMKDKNDHNNFIAQLKKSIQNDPNINLNCLAYLQKYLKIIKDDHLYISDSNSEIDYSSFFKVEKNLNSIKAQVKSDTSDDLVGVYNLLDLYKVAVIKDTDTYRAILLETSNSTWKVGQTKFILYKTSTGFEGIFYDGTHKPSFKKIEPKNGRLYPERWIKEDKTEAYSFDAYQMNEEKFQYKNLQNNTYYIRLGSFSGMTSNYNEAKKLLNNLENNGTKGNVIIDLRNNGGGGSRTSDLFRKFFKKNEKDLNIFVIQNMNCGSDCEQFIMKLKAQQEIKTFGENTRGAIAYGYGNYNRTSLDTPCNKFTLVLTTEKYEKYLPYEVVGIPPDVNLNHSENWISQVLKVIEK